MEQTGLLLARKDKKMEQKKYKKSMPADEQNGVVDRLYCVSVRKHDHCFRKRVGRLFSLNYRLPCSFCMVINPNSILCSNHKT